MGGGNMATMGGMQGPTDAGGGGASYMPNVGAMHGMGGWNFLNGMNIMMQFLDGMNSMMHGIHASTPPRNARNKLRAGGTARNPPRPRDWDIYSLSFSNPRT